MTVLNIKIRKFSCDTAIFQQLPQIIRNLPIFVVYNLKTHFHRYFFRVLLGGLNSWLRANYLSTVVKNHFQGVQQQFWHLGTFSGAGASGYKHDSVILKIIEKFKLCQPI